MKKLIVFIMMFCCLFFVGCKDKTLPQNSLERDVYNTGGLLSFVYDDATKSAIFGGEGEVVQYYGEDIAKGWTSEGCRVGVKLNLPYKLKDYTTATATIDGKDLVYSDFIKGEEIKYAVFQPIVSEAKDNITLKIKWNEDVKEQSYNIIIREGTLFMVE